MYWKKNLIIALVCATLVASVAVFPAINANAGGSGNDSSIVLSSGIDSFMDKELSELVVQYYSELNPGSTLSAEEIYFIAINELMNNTTSPPSIVPYGGVDKHHAINGGERIYFSSLAISSMIAGVSVAAAMASFGFSLALTALIAGAFSAAGIVITEYTSNGIVFDFIYYKNIYVSGVKIMVPLPPKIVNIHEQ